MRIFEQICTIAENEPQIRTIAENDPNNTFKVIIQFESLHENT